MTKIAIVRGSYFNKYEMQNYEPLARMYEMVGFAGKKPIHEKYAFPIVKLPSPLDLPNFPYKMPILNRLCLGDAMYLFGLEEKLKGFDIVHTRETYFHFTKQALNAKKKGWVKKVVCTCSETIPFNHEGIWFRKQMKQRAIKEVDLFHCLTKKAKQCLIKEGCNPRKIVVFPYGINLSKFSYQKSFKAKDRMPLRILYVGRFVKEKGIYDVLKIFVSLYRSNKNIRLTLVGDGPEKWSIINLIDQIRLNNVIKIKKVSYQNMSQEYQKSDIFFLLSKPTKYWEEYFGMSLIEAMASGLPIISTRCGAISEVVGKGAILIDPGDWKTGFKALQNLIFSKKLCKKLAKLALMRARKLFDNSKVSKNIEKLWR